MQIVVVQYASASRGTLPRKINLPIILNTPRTRIFCGPLPRPTALDFRLQRETEKSADTHYMSRYLTCAQDEVRLAPTRPGL